MVPARAPLDIGWQQCHGESCDLCHGCEPASAPPVLPAVTPRPSGERPATVTAARQVKRGHVVSLDDCDAVFGRELLVY